ncbi:MAG: hypothetical protein IKP47_04565 [Ruminococcus sp.]|nr:hypothetical protein [Ruminococcus sp.]
MNDKMLDIIGLADEKYLLEAEAQPARRIKHTRRFSAGMIAAAAAIGLMTVTAGAVAINSMFNKEEVNRFYNNSQTAEQIESHGYADGRSVENGHFRVTIQSFVSDDYRGQLVLTTEALDSQGEQYMKDLNGEFSFDLIYTDTGEAALEGADAMGTEEYSAGKPMTHECDLEYQIGKQYSIDRSRPLAVKVVCTLPTEKTEKVLEKYQDNALFEGLSFDITPSDYFKSKMLYSADGKELYVSEITVMAMGDQDEEDMSDRYFEIKYRDGTVRSCWGLRTHGGPYYNSDSEKYIGWYWAVRELLDVDSIESITFNGVEYNG